MKTKTVLLALLATLIFVSTGFAGSPKVAFPSSEGPAVSPDDRFAIVNVDSDKEPYHTLYLEDRENQVRRKLLDYGRSVEVLWNPESTLFAVTDYMGSNVSECFVLSTDPNQQRIDIQNEIQRRITNPPELASLQNDHVYYAAIAWTTPTTLKVKVWGHGDVNPSGFTRFYTYTVPQNR
jgi:hypothetical protein